MSKCMKRQIFYASFFTGIFKGCSETFNRDALISEDKEIEIGNGADGTRTRDLWLDRPAF